MAELYPMTDPRSPYWAGTSNRDVGRIAVSLGNMQDLRAAILDAARAALAGKEKRS